MNTRNMAGAFPVDGSAALNMESSAAEATRRPRRASAGKRAQTAAEARAASRLQQEPEPRQQRRTAPTILIGVLAVAAIVVAASVTSAGDAGYAGKPFPWGKSTFMFWLLAAVLFALASFTKKGLCFAIPVAGLHIAVFTLLAHGAMNGLTHPQSWWFGWPIAWNFVVLAMVWLCLPNGRSVAGAAV